MGDCASAATRNLAVALFFLFTFAFPNAVPVSRVIRRPGTKHLPFAHAHGPGESHLLSPLVARE